MTARTCSTCGTTAGEIQRDRHDEWLCLGCYERRPQVDDLIGTGPPCPGCGERRGARYRAADGRMVCWPCLGIEPEPPRPPGRPEWVAFRIGIIDRLIAGGWFVYIDCDRVLGTCPVCDAPPPEALCVRFHGRAARATIECSLGCADAAIAAALGIGVKG